MLATGVTKYDGYLNPIACSGGGGAGFHLMSPKFLIFLLCDLDTSWQNFRYTNLPGGGGELQPFFRPISKLNNCDVIEMKQCSILKKRQSVIHLIKCFIVKGQIHYFNTNFQFRVSLLPVLVSSYL